MENLFRNNRRGTQIYTALSINHSINQSVNQQKIFTVTFDQKLTGSQ